MSKRPDRITIIGAGPVGSLLSLYLARRGYNVAVYERRPDMRITNISGGRSINLALSNRGWLPLTQVGLTSEISKMIIPMRGRMMHDDSGSLTFQPYGKDNQAINSISRGGLNQILMTKAEEAGVRIHFHHVCNGVDVEATKAFLQTDGRKLEIQSDIIIGADGAFSPVRGSLQITDRFNYQQDYVLHGYKELSFPPGENGSFLFEENALHIWPRHSYMLIALPNKDGSFTVTLFLPFEGENSFEDLETPGQRQSFFAQNFPDAFELMESFEEDWNENPTSSLVTIRCNPWTRNRTLLIGDAAHAVVPFYGQGMNCGFEDCRVLNDILDQFDDNWTRAMGAYQQQRKNNADAIADLALENFVEMRDLVADVGFLTRKKIEARLHELYPDLWIPQYSMVTFNEQTSYAEARKEGLKHKSIMDKVMESPGIVENWETLDFESIVNQLEA